MANAYISTGVIAHMCRFTKFNVSLVMSKALPLTNGHSSYVARLKINAGCPRIPLLELERVNITIEKILYFQCQKG